MTRLFFTVDDTAERLSISKERVRALIRTGELPSLLLGGRCRRVPAEALEEWIRKQKEGAGLETATADIPDHA